MDEIQILGGLLGCGVVSAVALGIIALNVSKGVAVLSQWTVDKDSTESESERISREAQEAGAKTRAQADGLLAAHERGKSIQIGIKR